MKNQTDHLFLSDNNLISFDTLFCPIFKIVHVNQYV